MLPEGTAWLDFGTFESSHDASSCVRVVEERQRIKVTYPEEIAWTNQWISDRLLSLQAERLAKSKYGQYLQKLLH